MKTDPINQAPHADAGVAIQFFSGQSAKGQAARLLATTDSLSVVANDGGTQVAHASRADTVFSTHVGDVPLRIGFPGGGVAIATDNTALSRYLQLPAASTRLAILERNSWVVLGALIALVVGLVAAYQVLIPKITRFAGDNVPRKIEKQLGETALKSIDNFLLSPSRLKWQDTAPHAAQFQTLAKAAGLENETRLEFRRSTPNALALPGGIIIVTDELIKLMKSEPRLVGAVMAHELGHVQHRHSLKAIVQSSASAVLVSVFAGDVSGMSGLVAAAPVLLTTLAHTRDGEREADQYAFDLLKKAGFSPDDFADAMELLEIFTECEARRRIDLVMLKKEKANGAPHEQVKKTDFEKAHETMTLNEEICLTAPGRYNEGRNSNAYRSRNKAKTGYLHTHPVTYERIQAAREAAKK